MASQSFEAGWRHTFNSAWDACVQQSSSLPSRVRQACENTVNHFRGMLNPSPASDDIPLQANESEARPNPAEHRVIGNVAEIGTLELLGESVRVVKQRVSAGEVIIRKEVITETQLIEVPVRREELVIERLDADGNLQPLGQNDSRELRIVLNEQRVAVGRQPVVREIVRVSRQQVWRRRAMSEMVRHEELRSDDITASPDAPTDVEEAA